MRSMILLFAILVLGTGCAHHSHVHNSANPNMPAGVSVSGTGEAKAKPDVARANLGVEVRAATVEQATADANTRMAAVVSALKQAGVAEADLRTHNYSISFEQEPVPPPVPVPTPAPAPAPARTREKVAPEVAPAPAPAAPSIRGFYRVSNMVEVTIRDLTKVGQILSRATEAGANNVWGISFEIDDPYALRARARAQAMERAKQSAADLARLAGVELGDVIAVSESEGGGYMPMMKSMRDSVQMAVANEVPVEQGEITVTHQVQITFELGDKD